MRNGQAYQWKMEKFFVSEEKKFGKIDSCTQMRLNKVRDGSKDNIIESRPPQSLGQKN